MSAQGKLEMPPLRLDLEAAKKDLDEFGLALFFGAADEATLEEARVRLDEQAAGEDEQGCGFHDNGWTVINEPGAPNQRIWNLINKGEVFRRLTLNKTVHELIGHLLGEEFLLFSMTANIAKKGGVAQVIHGDQRFARADTPYPIIANCVWMLDEFAEENGATRVVPRSHLAGRYPDENEEIETVAATGPAGAIMIWDGRLWHGTGVNQTDRPRRGLLAAHCLPFIRTQENSTMSVAPEVLEAASPELLTLLGFRTWRGMGMVEGSAHGELNQRPTRFTRELRPGR